MGKLSSYENDTSPTADDYIPTIDTTSGLNRRSTVQKFIDLFFANTPASSSNKTGWETGKTPPTAVTYKGNRSYELTYAASIASYKSVGMRSMLTRTATAPTQCADLESGSSHYFNRVSASVAGMTFTDDFVVMAWVKLESFATNQVIASRYNGTSGWALWLDSTTGELVLSGYNASSANYSRIRSGASLPLGKWVHITAQLDMSAFTNTDTTSYVMFDGVNIPSLAERAGTNPTALVQAGNLEIGGQNAGTSPFDGKVAQVAIFSAKVTQTTARTYMSQGLSGSETNLISAYSLSNSLVDLNTTNANDLTAQNSASTADTDSPFAGGNVTETTDGTTEYAITTLISSDGLTETVQVPEGYAIPTSGGISALAYSTWKIPYGFPIDEGKWEVKILYRRSVQTASATYEQVVRTQYTVPVGAWEIYLVSTLYVQASGATQTNGATALSTATTSASEQELEFYATNWAVASLAGTTRFPVYLRKYVSVTTPTIYYQVFKRASTLVYGIDTTASAGVLGAKFALL